MTDEEIKQDEHWKYVTYCRECKYAKRESVAPRWRVWWCGLHIMQVAPKFWCAYGKKKDKPASEKEITVVA